MTFDEQVAECETCQHYLATINIITSLRHRCRHSPLINPNPKTPPSIVFMRGATPCAKLLKKENENEHTKILYSGQGILFP